MFNRFGNFLTIKKKFMLLMFLATLTPIVIINVLLNNYLKDLLTNNFISSTTKEIRQVDNIISTYFKTIEENAKLLATNPVIKKADDSITTFYNNKGNKEGKIKYTPLENGGVETEIFKTYLNFAESHPETAYVYLGTITGGYVQWPNSDLPAEYDPRVRPWYKTAMEHKGEVVRTEPYYWAVDDAVIISTVTTIENNSGQVVGVQGVDVSLKGLTDIVKDINIGDSGYIIMTTGDGTILANPQNPDLNFKNIQALNVEKLNNIAEIRQDSFDISMDNENYVANIYTSTKTGWKFIALVKKDELLANITKVQYFILLIGGIFVALAFVVSVIYSKKFSDPIVAAANFAQEIAAGNLSAAKLKTKAADEIGILIKSTNQMQDNLVKMIEQISNVATELVSTSEELAATSQEASSTMEEIMASMDGTAAELDKDISLQQKGVNHALKEMDELSQFIRQIAVGAEEQAAKVVAMAEITNQMAIALEEVADNAQAVLQAAKTTSDEAINGEKAVADSVKGMHEIKTTVFQAAQKISQLGGYSQQIGQIVSVIDEIAEQTNLLALNAAIEAARAGEYGKGFAVVADEVRKLAERSSKSTREIRNLITVVQELTEESVKAMERGTKEVEAGVFLSENAGKALKQIISNATATDNQINSISAVIEELSASSTEIVQSVEQVSNIAESNTYASKRMNEKAISVTEAITNISKTASNSSQFVSEATESASRVAGIIEEMASATEGLEEIARQLDEQITKFKM